MTVLEYVARFTELARFRDDYVATDATKVRRFKDGLKLSTRGKIVGHNLQDMDSMVSTALIIEREIENARSIHDAEASGKRKEDQPPSSLVEDLCPTSSPVTGPARANDMLLLPSAWTHEEGLPAEAGIPGFWADTVPIIRGTGTDSVCSFSLWCGLEKPVSVTECYASTSSGTDGPEGLGYGSRSVTRLTGQDFGDPGACLRHGTKG